MTLPGESQPLNYAVASSATHRNRIYRFVIAVSFGIAGFLGREVPIDVWRYFSVQYHQQRCIDHPIPANLIVYSSGVPILTDYSKEVTALLEQYANHRGWVLNRYGTVIFAGELNASNGLRRFVTIEAEVIWTPGKGADVNLMSTAAQYGHTTARCGSGGLSTRDTTAVSPGDPAPNPGDPEVVIHSASVDSKDPSRIHFTIRAFRYTFHSDGRLNPDGTFIIDTQ